MKSSNGEKTLGRLLFLLSWYESDHLKVKSNRKKKVEKVRKAINIAILGLLGPSYPRKAINVEFLRLSGSKKQVPKMGSTKGLTLPIMVWPKESCQN